jgi:uncharacterized phiE125 gp8 family phage protein
VYLLTAPTVEPVTVAECKSALRISGTAFDADLPGLIAAARDVAQQETGRQFCAQTWRIELEDWPAASDVFPIHRTTAAAVSYWNGIEWAALASGFGFYPAGIGGAGTGLAPALGTSWPTLGSVSGGPRVRIDLTAGGADATGVAPCVKAYIKALVGTMLDNPSLGASAAAEVNPLLPRLLDSQRLWA